MKTFNENAVIRGAIRRAFARHPVKNQVLKCGRREVPKFNQDGSLSKKPAVQYHCQVCDCWVSSTLIDVDHIEPVIDPERGFVDWNTFVARVFCGPENLQRICKTCHDKKTSAEKLQRDLKRWAAELDACERGADPNPKKTLKRLSKKPGVGERAAALLALAFPKKTGQRRS